MTPARHNRVTRPVWTAEVSGAGDGVTKLKLFFDLVFVFRVTQLARDGGDQCAVVGFRRR